jgi:hypothetical protein
LQFQDQVKPFVHQIDTIILEAIPPGRKIFGRALAYQLDIPYKVIRYHIRECLSIAVEITTPHINSDGRSWNVIIYRR